MCYYIDGKNYIAHSRNDLIDQINAMRVRFRTYDEYANATFEESFTKEDPNSLSNCTYVWYYGGGL